MNPLRTFGASAALLFACKTSGSCLPHPSDGEATHAQPHAAEARTPALTAETAGGAHYAGLYAYINQFAPRGPWPPINASAIEKPYVDGAAVVMRWDEIEPTPGNYEWTDVDTVFRAVIAKHKKLVVGVTTGSWTPAWLYGPGYGATKVVFSSYDHSNGNCSSDFVQPVVWDPVFPREYGKAMKALADHLKDLPGAAPGSAYDAVQMVKLSGLNLTTEELRLNAHPAGGPCHEPDTTEIWKAAGYTPSKLLGAWRETAAVIERAFPDKILNVAVIHRGAFPPIDEGGNVQKPSVPDGMTLEILRDSIPRYGPRLLVQWNALSQFMSAKGVAVLPQEVLDARNQGALIGWQLNGFMGIWGGTGCIYPTDSILPCKTVADFQAIFDNGIDQGGMYIEIQPIDTVSQELKLPPGSTTDFASAFQYAHERIKKERDAARPSL
jgi:hypothetical protein